MATYKNLIVWQKSMQLVKEIYNLCKNFPQTEIYGLTSQIKRSAVSIPSNIAEGRGRGTKKEFIQFLQIALGSTYELQTQIEIAKMLNFNGEYIKIENLLNEIEKMINSLILNRKSYA
jgi:four helix bundle protein